MALQYTQTNRIPYLSASSLASDIQKCSYSAAARVDQLVEELRAAQAPAASMMTCTRSGSPRKVGGTDLGLTFGAYSWDAQEVTGGAITRSGATFQLQPGAYLLNYRIVLDKPVHGFAAIAIKINGGKPTRQTFAQPGWPNPSTGAPEAGYLSLFTGVVLEAPGTIETVAAQNANDVPQFSTLTIARI